MEQSDVEYFTAKMELLLSELSNLPDKEEEIKKQLIKIIEK